jgi:AraC-like DNA-binding protein
MKQFSPFINDPNTFAYIDNVYIKEFGYQVHKHHKAQLIYAEGGIIHISSGDKHWYLSARNYMWIPAGMSHCVVSRSPYVNLFNFYFTVDDNDVPFFREANVYMVNDMLRSMIHYTKDWSGPVTNEHPTRMAFMKAIKAILPEMDLTIITFLVSYPYPKAAGLIKIAEYLSENMDSSFSLDDIARKFGYSSRTLSRLFKDDVGFSYVRFVRAIRITKALELIAENKHTVSEIAMVVGYTNLSAFSNIFERVVGIRPSEFMVRANRK